jgi:hypothetical protein
VETTADELEGLLRSRSGKTIRTRLAEIEAEQTPICEATFDADYRHQQTHDSLLDICVSAFGPQSEIFRRLNFGFLTSEPLKERGLKSFDCLLYNGDKKYALFVECKSSISSPSTTLTEIGEAIAVAETERGYIETQIGDRIEIAEYVLCTPAEEAQPILRAMRERETSGDSPSPRPILLWQVNRFVNQTLQMVPLEFRTAPGGQHRDPELTKFLAAGVRIDDAEVVSKVYPSSHPLRVANEILTELVFRNFQTGSRLQAIRKRDAVGFLSHPTNLIHYAGASIARELYQRFEREGLDLDLLTNVPDDDDRLEINIEGKTPRTVSRGYVREYRTRAAQRMARKRAETAVISEFKQKQTDLTKY